MFFGSTVNYLNDKRRVTVYINDGYRLFIPCLLYYKVTYHVTIDADKYPVIRLYQKLNDDTMGFTHDTTYSLVAKITEY